MEGISIIPQLLKKQAGGKAKIYLRGYFNRKVAGSKSTGYKIEAGHWDQEKKRLKPAAPNSKLINACLDKKIQAIEETLLKMSIMGVVLNSNQVRRAVLGCDGSRDFLQFCRERIVIDYKNKETRRTYCTECDKLEKFRAGICFADIDYEFLALYKQHMEQERENEENTVFKAFKFMNTFINKAIKIGGIILENPFDNFNRGKYIQKPKMGLEMHECDLIEPICASPTAPDMLRKVAIYFLLMCYSGMRFSDAMIFDPERHVKNGRLIMRYQKFSTDVNYEMHNRLTRIIDLVRANPFRITNKEFNIWLKVLGPMVGLELALSSHKGRHSLGGFLADLGVPIPQAQAIMGHKDPRSTEVYYHFRNKVMDRSVRGIDSL